jgi:hypothetical protein
MHGPWPAAPRGNVAPRLLLLGGVALLAGLARAADPPTDPQLLRGQALFTGTLDLHGRIRTHLVDLPPQVVVCGNCHAAGSGPDVPRSLAPRLTRDLLIAPRARRGGPVTIYNVDRFCTLLRKGTDPAYVLLSVEMPTYTLDDADCRALWQFVMRSEHEPSEHEPSEHETGTR